MKDWWLNLALREKQTVSIGILFVTLFLFYELIWSPISNEATSLRSKVQQNSALLMWMKQTDSRIQSLGKTQTNSTESSLLSTVQTQMNNSPLGKHVSQLRQSESNSVQLTLSAVSFDQMITWLTQVAKTDGIIVAQISVRPSGTTGIVTIDATLTS